MATRTGTVHWIIGTVLLGAVLTFGVYGVVVNAAAGETNPYVRNSEYIEECGACHLAYPPGLLPAKSWERLMQGLADHFGENAELSDEVSTRIADYLQKYALEAGQQSRMSQFLRNLPDDPPLRITVLPGFIAAHSDIPKQLGVETLKEGFLSPCADCHRTAASGIFDKELLHPGYGPKVWGGESDN
jgi:hypothetical protein